MCGRIVQATSPEEIAREFGAELDPAVVASVGVEKSGAGDTSAIRGRWYPRWNMAPSSRALVVAPYKEERGSGRTLGYGSWGLIPHWQKARTTRVSGLFNARAETVATLPSFRDAFRTGRVLVPIDAFYEWENPEHLAELGRPIGKREPKQPWAYLPSAGGRFALGGIATVHEGVLTFSLITTQANGVVGRIHDRMPVMLRDDAARAAWLDVRTHLDDVAGLFGPAPDSYVVPRRVSRLVSNARNEGPECLAEAGVEGLGLV
ncbi:MAG: SOS response-associated peptidase [Candidatus Limnocylindrus sp.]